MATVLKLILGYGSEECIFQPIVVGDAMEPLWFLGKVGAIDEQRDVREGEESIQPLQPAIGGILTRPWSPYGFSMVAVYLLGLRLGLLGAPQGCLDTWF